MSKLSLGMGGLIVAVCVVAAVVILKAPSPTRATKIAVNSPTRDRVKTPTPEDRARERKRSIALARIAEQKAEVNNYIRRVAQLNRRPYFRKKLDFETGDVAYARGQIFQISGPDGMLFHLDNS